MSDNDCKHQDLINALVAGDVQSISAEQGDIYLVVFSNKEHTGSFVEILFPEEMCTKLKSILRFEGYKLKR